MSVSASKVALVGTGVRLPGASGIAAFWDVLASGRCIISKVQEERFGTERHLHPNRAAPGRSVSFAAGQLERPYDFDPGYFGISPREAATMDPQQRLMLEVAVEALEHAGIPADALAGEAVGVYVGASSLDYGTHAQLDTASMDPQSMTGNTLSIIANRLSYFFDLRGPSYVIDTACSSSLLALHNACEDIRCGRVDTAIVGGVSMLLHPVPFIGFSRASMLSAGGLCRAFDAGADGYVRSEGAVALVLRAEDRARANGDPIRARLTASGVNSDGRTAGLSLPSQAAQAALLRTVYDTAELDPARLAFVEAHGTGTPIGDPIEAEALGTVLAQRRDAPLLIGSAKTNFGHLEPASGLVGVLKASLALAHDLLPASLHCTSPNPTIPFEALNLTVAREATPLPRPPEPRLAGVNSFGFGGANAHVVMEDALAVSADDAAPTEIAGADAPAASSSREDAPLILTAASKAALGALAAEAARRIARTGDVAEYANAAAHRRQRLAVRAVLAPAPAADMAAALRSVAEEETPQAVALGEAFAPAQRPVFLYSGNGSQWAGMGRTAYQAETRFRDSFDRVDRLFISLSGWSLVTMLFSKDLETEIERTEIAQPLLFALQVALTEALAAEGLAPGAVIGHSVGEVAAAWACGALSLKQAVRVIHARSTHQEVTRHLGGMAAVLISAEEAAEAIADFPGVELAAVNSPRSVTISGPADTLRDFVGHARKRRWAAKRLELDYPFHCALVDPIKTPLLDALARLEPAAGSIPMVSSVTGAAVDGTALDAAYWWDNVRLPVRFAAAVGAALQDNSVFVEIGPRPVLTGYVNDVARAAGAKATVLPSLTHKDADHAPIARILRSALAHGAAVDEAAVFGPKRASPDLLPSYPWQHAHHRNSVTVELVRLRERREHVLLGERLRLDDPIWRATLDAARLPFLADHAVEGAIVFPAAGFVEMALAVARSQHPGQAVEVRDLDIIAPLVLDETEEREVRTREFAPATVLIESRPRLSEDGWTPHAKATVALAPAAPETISVDADCPAAQDPSADPSGHTVLGADDLYRITARFGLLYGPAFQRADSVTLIGERRAVVSFGASHPSIEGCAFHLDPTVFDACFHALFAFLDRHGDGATTMLPTRLQRLVLGARSTVPARGDVRVIAADREAIEATITLLDATGAVVARADGVRFQAMPLARAAVAPLLVATPLTKRISREGERSAARATLPVEAMAEDGSEPTEAALLVEAGIQAAADRVLRPLFDTPVTLATLAARGDVAPNAVPLVARLLIALEASGRAEESEGAWRFPGEALAVADVVSLILAEHPERVAEAALIAALPTHLSRAIGDGLGADAATVTEALGAQLLSDAPFARGAFRALLQAVGTVSPAPGEARRLCLVGASNMGFVRTLASTIDPACDCLVIVDRDPLVTQRAALVFEPTPGATVMPFEGLEADGHPFDVVILPPALQRPNLDDVRRLLKPDGVVVGAAFAPSLLADVLGGLDENWWSGSADPEHPMGPLADAPEWQAVLEAAAFAAVTVSPVADAETDTLIFAASAPAQAAPPSLVHLPTLVASGQRARKTLTALSAMGEGAAPNEGIVHELVPGMWDGGDGDCVLAVEVTQETALPERLDELGRFLMGLGDRPRAVTLVTFGAHGHGGRDVRPTAAAIAGFARVAFNELPHLELRLVDLAPSFDPSVAAVRLAAELAQPNAEREIVLSSDHRAAVRYVPAPAEAAPHAAAAATGLTVARRGSIDHLAWRPVELPPLGAGDVRVAVEATGLNFRDVMWTLGLLPYEALQDGFAGATLGMECAGTVTEVGPKVRGLQVGDPVIAFAPAAFASHVTIEDAAAIKRPAMLSAAAAATIPVAFLTAYYALVELASLEEGECVLVHGGAGGVGLAALQIAKWRGARVLATAGTVDKRALLSELGADAVFDSRSLTFADEALVATDGEGVDVVLNSLAGEAMERSLGALKPFGRFCELGKRDFYADTKLGLRPFRRNLSYFGIDADQLMKHRPKRAKRVLTTLMALFEEGVLTPLPHRKFEADGVRDAFRLMQNAGHVGKIVVAAPPPMASQPATAKPVATPIADDKAHLLVGGTSGFGFATAEWLIRAGARHLVLASRSGVRDEAIAATIEAHRAAGVTIEVRALDVTDGAAVAAVVKGIVAERPLGGVFHMATVLDDALIPSLDAARYRTAMAPKVLGVEALDAATREVPHDLFVVYSSITVQLGNPGQANYVAANAYLEAFARRRRTLDLPALAIAWGAISDVGLLARDMRASEMLKRKLGRHAITSAEALDALGHLLEAGAARSGPAVRMVGKVDWSSARKDLKLVASPAFEDLADAAEDAADEGGAVDLSARLAGLTDTEAVAEVTKLLATEISRILKLPAAEVDPHKPLTGIGMDSLMGVELRLAAEQRLGIDIPVISLAAGATLTDLARKVVMKERGEAAVAEASIETLMTQHVDGTGSQQGNIAELAEAMRDRTAGVRNIIQ